ncbi:MAG: hypothetical protein ACYS5V_02960 [Planctomycetota bacterium]|jgi:hypothetical protein
MPGSALEKVRPGQPLKIPAGAYNAFVDSAQWVRGQQAAIISAARQKGRSPGLVTIRNSTTADLAWFDVVGIGDPIFTPSANLLEFRNRLAFEGNTPDVWTHAAAFGAFAVLLKPCRKGDFAPAVVSGVVQVQLDRGHSTHAFADIKDTETGYLESAHFGPGRILYHPGGSGPQWSVVDIGTAAGSRSLMGVLDEDLTDGSTADVNVLYGSAGAQSGETINATDRFLASGDQLDEFDKVSITYYPELRKWYATAAEC